MSRSFLQAVQQSKPLLGALLGIPSTFSAQIAARAGFKWVMIDLEHAPISAKKMTEMVHSTVAASGGTCLPVVRSPSKGEEWVKWILDSGAKGIVIPMCTSPQQAKDAVSNAGYANKGGRRSFGPFNAVYASTDPASTIETYMKSAEDIAVIVQIESKSGVEQAEEILKVPGVSACLVGPFDMRLTYDFPGGDGDEPEYLQALERVVAAGKANNVPVGTLAMTPEIQEKRLKEGFQFLLTTIDGLALEQGLKAALQGATGAARNAGA